MCDCTGGITHALTQKDSTEAYPGAAPLFETYPFMDRFAAQCSYRRVQDFHPSYTVSTGVSSGTIRRIGTYSFTQEKKQ